MRNVVPILSLLAVSLATVPAIAAPDAGMSEFVKRCNMSFYAYTVKRLGPWRASADARNELKRATGELCNCARHELGKINPPSHVPYAVRGFLMGLEARDEEELETIQSEIISDADAAGMNLTELSRSIGSFQTEFDQKCVNWE